ncbi:MAG: TonB-dependent receptor plug domain-containing protein [Prevotellaceae bacterium]|jgi:Fe2+ or Zn2+ uptake regulation protein|nr:TonB-dependent receptor plug domain-containing protein [Prevotellaceae bacterium]
MEKSKRNTKSKQLVADVLAAASSALRHEEIEKQLSGKVDRVTIYRILQSFEEDGRVHKIVDESGKSYYALCRHCEEGHHRDNHPHFQCIRCRQITCLETVVPSPKLPKGYRAVSLFTLVSGYCPSCFKGMKAVVTLFGVLLSTLSAGGQVVLPVDTLDHALQEVVVSAPGTRLQSETVIHVEKLPLGSSNPLLSGASLAERLSNLPGVSNWSTGAGIGKPVIRGLSGNRIAVYSQGVRMENQQWGEEHGPGLDEHGYGHVEVIKGPASLLYGSDAPGGVLYFMDEPYAPSGTLVQGRFELPLQRPQGVWTRSRPRHRSRPRSRARTLRRIGSPVRRTYHAFNFSTGIYQPIGGKQTLRLNMSSGFRTPTMFELLSNGVHEGLVAPRSLV